jgi:hypothetical protein
MAGDAIHRALTRKERHLINKTTMPRNALGSLDGTKKKTTELYSEKILFAMLVLTLTFAFNVSI